MRTSPVSVSPVIPTSHMPVDPSGTPTQPMAVDRPEVFNIASDMEDKTPPQQARRRLRAKQGMQVDIADNEDEIMSEDEKTGVKRQQETPYENKTAKIRKAKLGTQLVRDFPKLIYDNRMTVGAIKQQLIMRDIDFAPKDTKKDLLMIVERADPRKWKKDEPDIEIKND